MRVRTVLPDECVDASWMMLVAMLLLVPLLVVSMRVRWAETAAGAEWSDDATSVQVCPTPTGGDSSEPSRTRVSP